MGVVSGAVANSEGGKVTGIIPYAIFAAGGEKDKGDGKPKSNAIADLLDEKRRGEVRILGHSCPGMLLSVFWNADRSVALLPHNSDGNREYHSRYTCTPALAQIRLLLTRTRQIVVNSMHERKVEMAKRVGAFIGLPGGFGTFEEVRLRQGCDTASLLTGPFQSIRSSKSSPGTNLISIINVRRSLILLLFHPAHLATLFLSTSGAITLFWMNDHSCHPHQRLLILQLTPRSYQQRHSGGFHPARE